MGQAAHDPLSLEDLGIDSSLRLVSSKLKQPGCRLSTRPVTDETILKELSQ